MGYDPCFRGEGGGGRDMIRRKGGRGLKRSNCIGNTETDIYERIIFGADGRKMTGKAEEEQGKVRGAVGKWPGEKFGKPQKIFAEMRN